MPIEHVKDGCPDADMVGVVGPELGSAGSFEYDLVLENSAEEEYLSKGGDGEREGEGRLYAVTSMDESSADCSRPGRSFAETS